MHSSRAPMVVGMTDLNSLVNLENGTFLCWRNRY